MQEGYTGYGTYQTAATYQTVREVQVGLCDLPVLLIPSVRMISVKVKSRP